MPELSALVDSIDPIPHAAIPTLALKVRLGNSPPNEAIAGISLQCQILIETPRRSYSPQEREKLAELFGDANRRESVLRTMLWTHVHANVPAFAGSCEVALFVPCTFDFNIAAIKYFHALQGGDIPLLLQFSGTVFFHDIQGRLQISRIPWSLETRCSLPAATWNELRNSYYPNATWLCVPRATFERLCDLKRREGLPSWEQTLDRLLATVDERARMAERVR